MLVVYFVCGVAETNRAPFDVVEGESEIVAGHMVEYSGMTFALFFLAEYMNMILIAALTAIMFFGGWLAPVDSSARSTGCRRSAWLLLKIFVIVSMFLWIRATFPRYRYDQIMRLGWKVFIPLTLVWIVVIGAVDADAAGAMAGTHDPRASASSSGTFLLLELFRAWR